MALEGEILPILNPTDGVDSITSNADELVMHHFEEDGNNLMTSDGIAGPESIGFAPDENAGEATEQFLTISQGANQISVNDDGSIIYSDQGLSGDPLAIPTQHDEPSLVNIDENAFYMQSNEGLEGKIMEEDMLNAQDNDNVHEFSGNTFLYNKSDGTLTQVSSSQSSPAVNSSIVHKVPMKNFLGLQPEIRAVKRPAFVNPSTVRAVGRKIFVQNTTKGPVVKAMAPPIQKISGAKTISLAQAQRLGLLKPGQHRVLIKKVGQSGVSSGSGSSGVVLRQPTKILPHPVTSMAVRPQPFRTVASSSQYKNVMTNTLAQQRQVTVNKFSLPGRPTQKIFIRPNSGLVKTMQIGGKTHLVKVISPSVVKPKFTTIGNTQSTLLHKPFMGKQISITPSDSKINISSLIKHGFNLSSTLKTKANPTFSRERDIITLDDEPLTIKIEEDAPSEQHVAPSIDDIDMQEQDEIDHDPDELVNEEESERGKSPQKLLEANGIRPKKPCNCTRSQCLKLYCECFANGEFCFECNCNNCFNNIDHEEERQISIKTCLERNPDAFRRKMQVASACSDSEEEKERRQNRGCNCKKSHCLKNYCECFEGKLTCCKSCRCTSCRNTEEDMAAWMRGETMDSGDEGRETGKGRSFMPKALAEALCNCIMVQAESADRAGEDTITTEQRIIEELGQRLVQIIGNRRKDSR